MSRLPTTIALLLCGLIAGLAGCAVSPKSQQDKFQMPGAPRTPATPSSPHSGMPGPPSYSPLPGYQQAGYRQGSAAIAPPSGAFSSQSTIAQVGYSTSSCDCCPAPSGGGSISAGHACHQCGPSDCKIVPHGYALQTPAGWNAYGIDPQEFICDGGDHDPKAVVRRDDTVGGLQPEDTIVHYTTEAGDIEVQASNRACLYAPRFSSVRKITGAVAGEGAVSLAQVDRPMGANRFDAQLPGLVMTETTELGHADVARPIDAMRENVRGVPVETVLQLQQTGDIMPALAALSLADVQLLRDDEQALYERFAMAAVQWELDECLEVVVEDLKTPTLTRDEQLQGFTVYDFPDAGRLRISKLADRSDAQPGEIVTFAIRVENVGDSAVDHVEVIDNLVTRLEYVDESQTCSGGAEFEAMVNQGQSLKLKWRLTDKLRVGESVTIRFQCTVR